MRTTTLPASSSPRRAALSLVPVLLAWLSPPVRGGGAGAEAAGAPVVASIDTTLPTGSEQIRQFAFDGDPGTFFASARNPGAEDHFTLVLDRPVAVRSLAVAGGRPEGGPHQSGTLEVSTDGTTFGEPASFVEGRARGGPYGLPVRAVRIRPAADQGHPLVLREIELESDPPVAVFRYPIEVQVDVSDAPEMKEWAENVARICERSYPMINEELKSEGFRPRHFITMRLRNDYNGVAATSGGRIIGSVTYFKRNPEDVGAMVHETVHNVQAYRRGNAPGWLVEGICDYVRFFKFEPGKIGRINRERARYDRSYRVTAAFLAYVCEKYDREFVRKLNAIVRAGGYREAVFKELTGKTVQELDEEWRRSLRRIRI